MDDELIGSAHSLEDDLQPTPKPPPEVASDELTSESESDENAA